MSKAGVEAMKKWKEENKGVKLVVLNPIEKLKTNPKSLRYSINAKCYDCSNFQREEIRNCPMKACGLWNVRPYQRDSEDVDE